MGQNPGTNHPRMLTTLQAARRRGCEIIAINPIREIALEHFTHPQEITKLLSRGEPISSLYLQVKIGGDIALLKGLMKVLLERGAIDSDFIQTHTAGFEAYRDKLAHVTWDEICASSGLTREDITKCAEILSRSKTIIACWAMGLTQHEHAVGNIQEIVNLMLMLGQVGKPGAGLCPVRGHSNVQGDRTMGIYEKPSPALLAKLKARYGFDPPQEHGFDTVDAIQAMRDGRAKVFVGLGGNFLSATPDTPVTTRALERCALTVHVSTKLNRAHLHCGETALILPTLSRVEKDFQSSGQQFVTVEDSMSAVHASKGMLRPSSQELMSEPAIVAGVAHATLGSKSRVDWLKLVSNYDLIRDEVEQTIPDFERFNERVRHPDGFVLPNKANQRNFVTPTNKAIFVWHDIVDFALAPEQLLLTTIRSHDQFNTSVYSKNDRYRGVHGNRMVLFMNEGDMRKRGLSEQSVVNITSHFRGETRTLKGFSVVPFDIAPSSTAAYFPECNPLVPLDYFAKKSRTPASKSLIVTLS
jgi:molybdopterin-dependent oxidoreductase alpha subunit